MRTDRPPLTLTTARTGAPLFGAVDLSRVAALAFLACGACARGPTSFVPVETSPETVPAIVASYYDIQLHDRIYGDVKVWTPGAFKPGTKQQRPVLEVVLRVRNDADAPITLELGRVDLELVDRARELFVVRDPTVVAGQPIVAPGVVERISLVFPLPAGVEPDEVVGFEVSWAVRTPGGLFSRSTPFTREPEGPPDVFGWYRPLYIYENVWWHGPFWPRPEWGPGP